MITKKTDSQTPISFKCIEDILDEVNQERDMTMRRAKFEEKFSKLPKTEGICIVIDIVDSTALKSKDGYNGWVLNYFNFFLNMIYHINDDGSLGSNERIFYKSIGDGIMIFIPLGKHPSDEQLNLINGIESILMSEKFYGKLRVSVHHCEEAFYLGFPSDDRPDYYGLDIDIAFRLNGEAKPQQLVISEEAIKKLGISDSYNHAHKIGECKKCLKGLSDKVSFSIYELKKDNLPTVPWSS